MLLLDTMGAFNTSIDNNLFSTYVKCLLAYRRLFFLAVSSHKRERLNTSVYGIRACEVVATYMNKVEFTSHHVCIPVAE